MRPPEVIEEFSESDSEGVPVCWLVVEQSLCGCFRNAEEVHHCSGKGMEQSGNSLCGCLAAGPFSQACLAEPPLSFARSRSSCLQRRLGQQLHYRLSILAIQALPVNAGRRANTQPMSVLVAGRKATMGSSTHDSAETVRVLRRRAPLHVHPSWVLGLRGSEGVRMVGRLHPARAVKRLQGPRPKSELGRLAAFLVGVRLRTPKPAVAALFVEPRC